MYATRAIIFDIGNVLVFHDNDQLCLNLARLYELDAVEVRAHVFASESGRRAALGELTAAGMHAEFCRRFGVTANYPDFATAFSSHFTPNTAIEPLIRSLAGRFRLLTLSNTNPMHVEYMREHLRILDAFDDLLLSCELGLGKPQPEIYAEAVRRSGCSAAQCLFTDDVPAYVDAARAAGLKGIVFTDAAAFERDLRSRGIA